MIAQFENQTSAVPDSQLATVTPIGEGEVVGAVPVMIPEGDYTAQLLYHETASAFRDSKLYLHFKILDFGEHFGKNLYRAYRVKRIKGKPGRGGAYQVGRRSELYLMLMRVCPGKYRTDRISLHVLKNLRLRIKVRTVTKDYRGRELPEALRYSVVDDVLAILEV